MGGASTSSEVVPLKKIAWVADPELIPDGKTTVPERCSDVKRSALKKLYQQGRVSGPLSFSTDHGLLDDESAAASVCAIM